MELERFKTIVKYNQKNQKRMCSKVRSFYAQTGIEYERELLNVMQIARPLFQKKNYMVLEMPFRDAEIGAICYKGDALGYTFLNTSLPKVNVNFALGHEIYHLFYQNGERRHRIEFYLNEHYFEQEEELEANLFSGMLLMPEQSFFEMFRKFSGELGVSDTTTTLIVKLMSYFQVPYMAVLIRCYELGLLCDGTLLEELLAVSFHEIREEFLRLWLDDSILNATKRNDYEKFESLVSLYGKQFLEDEIINGRTYEKALKNMREIYMRVKGD